MKKISTADVHQGIQYLYNKGLTFGQRVIHVRGDKTLCGHNSDTSTGVEEKLNIFLNWEPHKNESEIPDDGPKFIPYRVDNEGKENEKRIIQNSHHSAVAWAIMNTKNFYQIELPTEVVGTIYGQITDYIFINEGSSWHITALRNNQWDLFDGQLACSPDEYWRDAKTPEHVEGYKATLDQNSRLANWLP